MKTIIIINRKEMPLLNMKINGEILEVERISYLRNVIIYYTRKHKSEREQEVPKLD